MKDKITGEKISRKKFWNLRPIVQIARLAHDI
jgi:hypothetical protein